MNDSVDPGVRVAIATPSSLAEGPMWVAKEQALWYVDIPACRLHRFVPATMANRRVFARFPPRSASGLEGYGDRPDGAAVDAEGCYWVAMYEGGCVLRFSPAGELLREVHLPALCPTMPCFAGPNLKTVYVTSASINRSTDELARLPHSGCVFAFEVDVPGLPTAFAAAISA
jgi:sugar lactone lactonase YvrE